MKNFSLFQLKGVDLSAWNEITDYTAMKNDGIDFGILKIIRNDGLPDKRFETHWNGFEEAEIPIQGVYNYTYATTVAKAVEDANSVIRVLGGRKSMVWLDVENDTLRNLGHLLIDIIRAYADIITKAGLEFGIYTYVSFYNSYLKAYASELNYPFWIARYPSSENMDPENDINVMKCPDIGKMLYGWQYSSKGKINGAKGNVDMNVWFVDIEATVYEKPAEGNYITDGFRKEIAKLLGLKENATPAEILQETVTISSTKNKNHISVTALERLLKNYGYYNGEIEADMGKRPTFGNGMSKATILYQTNVVKLKKADGEWTSGNSSYKKSLGL